MMSTFSIAIATMVLAATGAMTPSPQRFAILIGANTGHTEEAPLTFTGDDVRHVRDVLLELGDFAPDHILTLDNPTPSAIEDTFVTVADLARQYERDDTLLFIYYSGHGDALGMHLQDKSLTWTQLVTIAKSVPCGTWLMVLDACRAGGITHVKGARLEANFAVRHATGQALPRGFAIVTSASAGESAQESVELRGSLFTYYFTNALRGAADLNKDGRITLGEAFSYTADRTMLRSAASLGGVQHATFEYNLRGRADLPLTRGDNQGALLALAAPRGGTLWIRRGAPDGPLVAEVTTAPEDGRTLWLQRDIYYARWRSGTRVMSGVIIPSDGQQSVEVARLLFTEHDLTGAISGKGGAPEHDDGTPFYLAAGYGLTLKDALGHFTRAQGADLLGSWQLGHLVLDAHLRLQHATSTVAADPWTLWTAGAAAGVGIGTQLWDRLLLSLRARLGVLALAEDTGPTTSWQAAPQGQVVGRADLRVVGPLLIGLELGYQLSWQSMRQVQGPADQSFVALPQLEVGLAWRF